MSETWTSEPYNAEGIDLNKQFEPVPAGRYDLEITEIAPSISSGGYKQVSMNLKIINSLSYNGREIKFHRVMVLPNTNPGAFLALKFLAAIGEPHTGKFNIVPARWLGKRLSAMVKVGQYTNKEGEIRPKNEIEPASVTPFNGSEAVDKEEEIPF